MEETEKKKYEITFWLKEENGAPVKDVLRANGCDVLEEKEIHKMQLAYPIKKERFAFLGNVTFASRPEAVRKIGDSLNLDHMVLRYAVTGMDERKAAPPRETVDNARSGFSSFRERAAYPSPARKKEEDVLTNESLEKKIEEILN